MMKSPMTLSHHRSRSPFRRLAILALAALALTLAWSAGSGADRADAQSSAIWDATMTVGEQQNGAFRALGYIGSRPGAITAGTLSPSTFSIDGVTFTVSYLGHSTTANPDTLYREFNWNGTPTFASSYALCFDGTLAFTGTASQMFGTSRSVQDSAMADPSWSRGDMVDVKLYEGSTCSATAPEINVKGNNVDIADGDMSPRAADHTDFGSTAVSGGTVTRTFTIENTGGAALSLSGNPKVAVGGTNSSEFTVTQPSVSSVAAGSSTTFTVTFNPSDTGARRATLSIANNDANENPYNFAIQGTGTGGPGFTVTPSTLTVAENGGTATFSVKLNTQPTDEVAVLLGPSDESVVKIKDPTLPPQTALTFTTSNWGTAQSVTVIGVNDDVENPHGGRQATIEMTTISSDSAYLVSTERDVVTVTVTDDDAAPPTRSGGGTGAYQFLADDCEATFLAADGTFSGRWSDDPDCETAYSSRNVSRFYWFTLPEGQSEVTFTLQGGGSRARMWLWPEWTQGHVAVGDAREPMRARFLTPGVHYLEVASGASDGAGAFTITMDGIGAGDAGLSCMDTSWTFTGPGSVEGRWDAGCASGDTYRRGYNLVLAEPELVTIDVTSEDADPILVLSTGNPLRTVARNDDYQGSNRRSHISQLLLPAGTYHIDVDSKGTAQAGTFKLSITIEPSVSCAETYRTITVDTAIEGEWKPICEYSGGYERYYDLVVAQRREVTVTLDSDGPDPLLVLSRIGYVAGTASLTELESNDGSTTRSRIVRTLDPGRYRISARAKNAGETGGFTLTVAGLSSSPLSMSSCADTFQSFTADHTVTGAWGPGCDRDRTANEQPYYQRSYDLVVERKETITLVLTSDDADPLLRLYDSGGGGERTLLASNDDDGSTSRSRIVRKFEPGRYRIVAATEGPEDTGSFTLAVTEGTKIFGQWDSATDYQTYTVNTGGKVVLALESPDGPENYSTDLHFTEASATPGAPTAFWSAKMTVSNVGSTSIPVLGYGLNLSGSLSPSTFSHRGVSFTVLNIAHGTTLGQLIHRFSWTGSPNFAGSYALCLDGVRVVTGTATQVFGTSEVNITTALADPSWSAGQTVAVTLTEGTVCGSVRTSSVKGDSRGLRSDRDASLTVLGVRNGNHTIDARLSPMQINDVGNLEPIADRNFTYPIRFVLTYHEGYYRQFRGGGGQVPDAPDGPRGVSGPTGPDTAPTVTDTSQFKTHYFLVGQSVSLTLPAADADSGNGGPYDYKLWHKGAGKSFNDEAINGLSFDPRTRTLTGTPEAEGEWPLSYVVHDGDGNRNAATDAFRERDNLKIVVEPDGQAVGNSPPQQFQSEPVNRAPSFDANIVTTLEVAENSAAGTSVGAPITATDPDEDTLTYSLSGDDAASFAIDAATGQITTVTGVTYDYEVRSYLVAPSYSLTVTADDGRGGQISTPVTVSLTDVDDAPAENLPPEFHEGESTTREVAENSPAGTNVGKPVTAYDLNGDALSYIALDGADSAAFSLDADTGQLTTVAGVTYDYETKSSYQFMIIVMETETAEGYLSGISVTVNLTDVDETQAEGDSGPQESQSEPEPPANQAPDFDANVETTLAVAENSAAGTNVGDPVTATDPDDGDTLTYSLSGTDAASFAIDSATGQITTKAGVTYDYETDSSYSLAVDVSDGNGGQISTPVTVNLTDVNEDPSFSDGTSTTREVAENSTAGTNVGAAVTATDPDAGNTLTYTLSGTDAASFDIGSTTGQITTKTGVAYDYETKSSYSLTVEASDSNEGTASIAVTVNLTDVAEATPVTACTTSVGTLAATALYAGAWDDADCKAHHQDSRARYFSFTLSADATVDISLSAGALYVSKDTPNNGWGTVPGPGYEHRREVRRNNGKLVHDGPYSATADNDGNTVTLDLVAGETYTVEAADDTGGTFTVSIAPQ